MDLKKELAPYAQEQGRLYGILPSFIMAVAALETGFGSSQLCNEANNLFSIKGTYKGSSITFPTSEYLNGKWVRVNAQFRKYPSLRESVIDFCELIKNGVSWNHSIYSRAVIGKTDITQVCYDFGKTPYMTDPAYAGKLLACIKSENYTSLDHAAPVAAPEQHLNTETSIVDYLKSIGKDSSFAACAILARQHGIQNYRGTAAQNIELLHLLKGGK